MIEMLEGEGAQWSEMTMSPTDIADALEGLSEEERFDLGFSAWHFRRGMEREAQNAKIKRVCLSSLHDALALAEHDGDTARASMLRMKISAALMMEVAEDIVDLLAEGPSEPE